MRRVEPLPRHLRGGTPLDTSGVTSHNLPPGALTVRPPPPLVRKSTATGALDLQDFLDDTVVLGDKQVREPNVNNPVQPPPTQPENLSMNVSGHTSSSDAQHDSSGSSPAPAVEVAGASQPAAPVVDGAGASQQTASATIGTGDSQPEAPAVDGAGVV